MATPKWHVRGEYFETCNCDFLCPCISTNLAGRATHGICDFAVVLNVEHGHYGDTHLDGLKMAVIAHCPGPSMADGNLSVGLILDARANPEQQAALTQIGSGQGGGPMAALGPLVTKMLGVELRPIEFAMHDLSRSVMIAGLLDQAVEGVPSPSSRASRSILITRCTR